jgi:thiamine-monophosphate kinase
MKMIKNEEGIIDYIKSNIKTTSGNVVKSIGDDCAVIKISPKKYFVITTDTSLMGPHFTKNYSPYEIGYKSLATNLSDIAAMGCVPKYIFMALTIPKLESEWVKSFYKGIKCLTEKYNVALIGGDTNRGPLSISIQVIGENKKNIIYRDGAKNGEDIYVTGKLGCARAALMITGKKKFQNEFKLLKKYLHLPIPRIDIGIDISKFASSCIDISDGIAKDLHNIIVSSKCGADVFIDKIPTHKLVKKIISPKLYYEALIGGGEDYELCFTANKKYRKQIDKISKKHSLPITKIGVITKNQLRYFDKDKLVNLSLKGFDHFSK